MDPTSPVPVLGMVGGGQLARMTHQAAVGLAIDLRVLTEGHAASTAAVAAGVTVGSWRTLDDLRRFASGCDVITFDHELTPPAYLAALEDDGFTLRPSAAAERYAQDKAFQRRELGAAGFPLPRHVIEPSVEEATAFGDEHGWPIVVKAARGGYDGRGVWVVEDAQQTRQVLDDLASDGVHAVIEERVELAAEVAVAVARRPGGEQVRYAVTETVQRDGICVELVVPAPVAGEVATAAAELAADIVDHVEGTGVVAVELFVATDGRLLVNELALRPHNSVHWSIEGARTSQFQNHVRAVLDLPLGETTPTAGSIATVNVLGPADGSDPRRRLGAALGVPGVAVHLYGKDPRPGRKLGHVTAVGDDADRVLANARRAAALLTDQEQP